jgi:Cys-rich repeat protein
MRLVVLIVLAACSGPLTPPHATRNADPAPEVMRPPPNAPPDPIGTTRPGNRSCTENRDCRRGEVCLPPDHAPPGPPPQCQTDAQCTTGEVCNDTACVAPCPQAPCSPGQACSEGGHCKLIPCNAPGALVCPQNHRCSTASGACERQTCTSRSQCDVGACFQGRCFAHDAYCMPQNP